MSVENICLDQNTEQLVVPESKKDVLYDITFVLDRSGSMASIKLELISRGETTLLDAVGRTIYATEQRFTKLAAKPDKILFVIITDGLENSSKEFTRQKIKELVSLKEAEGWSFTFLGANLDAFAEGGSLGFAANASNAININRIQK